MTQTRPVSSSASLWTTLAAAFTLVGVMSVPADAAPHRARLSRDLADRVAAGREDATSVIVSGTPETLQALAARYGGADQEEPPGRRGPRGDGRAAGGIEPGS